MFRGSYIHSLDSKCRVSIPIRYREIINNRYDDRLIITVELDRCLSLYPLGEWKVIEEKMSKLSMIDHDILAYWRRVNLRLQDCVIDKQGRILIPQKLKEYVGLNSEVIFIGVYNKIEIWDKGMEEDIERNGENEKIRRKMASFWSEERVS
ncbi:MAG: division/cell wall cluster transcriptional repressor MraZ [Nitrospirota bacterium]